METNYNGRDYYSSDYYRSESMGGEYNISSAIDWSRFEGRDTAKYERRTRTDDKTRTGSAAKKSSAARKRTKAIAGKGKTGVLGGLSKQSIQVIFFAAIFAVTCGILVSCKMEEHLVADSILKQNALLEGYRQDHEVLQLEFDTKINNAAVEEYAVTVLGMQKCETSQIEYISMSNGDMFEHSGSGDESRLAEEIDRLLSYLN